jgi:hypothetical protein
MADFLFLSTQNKYAICHLCGCYTALFYLRSVPQNGYLGFAIKDSLLGAASRIYRRLYACLSNA